MKNRKVGWIIFLLCGCAPSEEGRTYDPFESVNRSIYFFNRVLDHTVFFPIITLHDFLPSSLTQVVPNVISTWNEPISIANSLLQGEWLLSVQHATRCIVNLSFGLGGLIDVASIADLKPEPKDFGQTLQKMGFGPGIFIMIPILGPCTLRDGIGKAVDCLFQPLTYWKRSVWVYYPCICLNIKWSYASFLDDLDQNFHDPYATMRDGYLEVRRDTRDESDE